MDSPPILSDEIRAHCEMIPTLASPLAGQGKLVIACFGEAPTQLNAKTGTPGCPAAALRRSRPDRGCQYDHLHRRKTDRQQTPQRLHAARGISTRCAEEEKGLRT